MLLIDSDVMEKEDIVDMAESCASMKATHTCTKTYSIRNRTGEIVTVTTPALFVWNVHQDLFRLGIFIFSIISALWSLCDTLGPYVLGAHLHLFT